MMKTSNAGVCQAGVRWLLVTLLVTAAAPGVWAQTADAQPTIASAAAASPAATKDQAAQPAAKPRLEIYGAAMLDMGYDVETEDPFWFDVLRPTKLPAFKGEFGEDGHFFSGVRQSRFGVKSYTPTDLGELRIVFEYELFGTGVDAGQTTFRLRHVYGELGQFLAGQTWSPFMDPDVFPNSIEYWGPNGMVFFRNVQARWTPWSDGGSNFMVALERPGASGDQGQFAERIELQNINGRFPFPDISSHFRWAPGWGHVQVAGIVRWIKWDDVLADQFDLSGDDFGWGINLSSNVKLGRHVAKLQFVFGEGVQNYMNDAPVDVAVRTNAGNPVSPIVGEALGLIGTVAFIDLNWSDKWTSTAGYSSLDIDNSDGQRADAFRFGQYALGNILYHPLPNVYLGPELQWGKRENFSDGFSSDDWRVQFSVRWAFNHTLGGQ